MDTNISSSFKIVSGPFDRDKLFDALKYSQEFCIRVHFDVALNTTVKTDGQIDPQTLMPIEDIKIIGIIHEDNSGRNFKLIGSCKADIENMGIFRSYRFNAHYHMDKRKGSILFFK